MFLITYDEHGGLYDHVPPENVPAPVDRRGLVVRLLRLLWRRKAHSFDFKLLGPRVPAVLVSPLVESGTVVHDARDHASIPATLRSLFAPTAKPLTRRDAWSPPFHTAATRTSPRADMPDLSPYCSPALSEPVAFPQPPASVPPDAAVPNYYREFIKQADLVRKHLEHLGEPEMKNVTAQSPIQRAGQITAAFAAAAHRHRHPNDAPTP